jgi:aspartate kinase
MKVFKFGGASLKNASAIKNMASIVKAYAESPLLVVVSAMGKTTNALESILNAFKKEGNYQSEIQTLRNYHFEICDSLFEDSHPVKKKIESVLEELADNLQTPGEYDQVYDQVISLGEVISSVIVSQYLIEQGLPCQWLDARKYIITDTAFREGKVDWKKTEEHIHQLKVDLQHTIFLTQGFIGSNVLGFTTTLGREGSDYTAAIFASCLQAESVTIWKDVPGVMSADPKRLPGAIVFEELPYTEAAEMTYYGASVIHPKTIKPLAVKQIPLYVKSFDDYTLPGTKIHECQIEKLPPLIVFKDNQCLLSCRVTDYTFINEEQMSIIFNALADLDIKINVMQNSAISFSFCIDFRESKLNSLLDRLQQYFEVYYNTGLTLITVKNYDSGTFNEYRKKPGILIEQSSRSTLQILLRN